MLLYSWFFFLIIKYNIYIYKCPTIDLKKIIKYIIYFKYILNMGGSVGRVGFGGFVIL